MHVLRPFVSEQLLLDCVELLLQANYLPFLVNCFKCASIVCILSGTTIAWMGVLRQGKAQCIDGSLTSCGE